MSPASIHVKGATRFSPDTGIFVTPLKAASEWKKGKSGIQRNKKKWLSDKDSNPDKEDQNLVCYHYTIGQAMDPYRYQMNEMGSSGKMKIFLTQKKEKPLCPSGTQGLKTGSGLGAGHTPLNAGKFSVFVIVVNVDEVAVSADEPAGPVEGRSAFAGISGCFDCGGFEPFMVFGVSIRKTEGAVGVVEDGERIDPSWGRKDINDPGAQVIAARVGFLDKYHGSRRLEDLTEFLVWRLESSLPSPPVHAIGFGVTIIGPSGSGTKAFAAKISRAMMGRGIRDVFEEWPEAQPIFDKLLSI